MFVLNQQLQTSIFIFLTLHVVYLCHRKLEILSTVKYIHNPNSFNTKYLAYFIPDFSS